MDPHCNDPYDIGGSRLRILAIERERPGVTVEQFQPHLRAEAACVWELYQADVIREMYFDRDHHTAVLMLECSSVEQAREKLCTLPLVREELIAFDLIPLIPYSGFSRLFSDE
jgi:hypothetical protein